MLHVLRKLLLLSAILVFYADELKALNQVVPISVADEHDDALKAIKRGDIMSYAQIKKSVEKKLNGRVVDIKLRRTNRGWQYFMRVSTKKGRVVAAVVDARNGRVISRK